MASSSNKIADHPYLATGSLQPHPRKGILIAITVVELHAGVERQARQ
jgi:hypothetical protein